MNNLLVKLLGHDILWCERPEEADDELRGRTRFLDKLWLPCDLALLTKDQILVINRYREGVIATEGQYQFARSARRTMHRVASALRSKKVVEIGCGKYPVEVSSLEYLGVDIDDEAITFIRSLGLSGCHPDEIRANLTGQVDLIVSVYAMHFSVSEDFLANLASLSTPDAIICFNLIVEDAVNPISLLARLAPDWPFAQVVKTDRMARREYFFIAGRPYSHSKINDAVRAVREALLD